MVLDKPNAEPTSAEIWNEDRLGKKQEAALVLNYVLRRLDAREKASGLRNFVLNVDAPWGSGKTFFLERMQKDLKAKQYIVAAVNAWESDHSDDPMMPVLAAIKEALAPLSPDPVTKKLMDGAIKNGVKIAAHLAKGAAKTFARRYVGDALETLELGHDPKATGELAEEAKELSLKAFDSLIDWTADKALAAHEKNLQLAHEFKRQLAETIASLGAKAPNNKQLFLFVDELDRCRPSYAIEMLERIKHIFNVAGIAVILATDTAQLRHSIRAVYGSGFDAERYLHRFFDRQYELRKPSAIEIVRDQAAHWKDHSKLSWPQRFLDLPNFIDKVVTGFQITPRDIIQCLNLLDDIVVTWESEADIELSFLLPLIIIYHSRRELFDKLQLHEMSPELRKDLNLQMSWNLVSEERAFGGHIVPALTFRDIFNSYYEYSRRDFQELVYQDRQHLTQAQNWALDRFQTEHRVLHKGMFVRNGPKVYSILSKYFEIVRNLSRFN